MLLRGPLRRVRTSPRINCGGEPEGAENTNRGVQAERAYCARRGTIASCVNYENETGAPEESSAGLGLQRFAPCHRPKPLAHM